MPEDPKPVILFDLLSVAYRWYFAMKANPMSHRGLNTSPLHGTVQTVLFAAERYGTDNLVICADTKGAKTFRHEIYPKYKSDRHKTEEDMNEALKHLEPMIKALDLPVVKSPNFEADDVLATYATQAEELGYPCMIVTGDKDLLMLVNDSTYVVRWENDGSMLSWTPRIVKQRYGFRHPTMIADMLAIEGDTADCYKGIPGVGKEKARRWVKRFGDLDSIWRMREHMDPKEREKLEANIEEARLCKRVSMVVRDVPDLPALSDLLPWKRAPVEDVEAYLSAYAMNRCIALYKGHVPKSLGGEGADYCPPVTPPPPGRVTSDDSAGFLF